MSGMAKEIISGSICLQCKRIGDDWYFRWSDSTDVVGVGKSREDALEDLVQVRRDAFLVYRDPSMGYIIREEPRFPVRI